MEVTAHFTFDQDLAPLLLRDLLYANPRVTAEAGDHRLAATHRTKSGTTSFNLEVTEGRLLVRFYGPRRALADGTEDMQLLVSSALPWDRQGDAAFTMRSEHTELTLWGEVVSANTSNPEVPLWD